MSNYQLPNGSSVQLSTALGDAKDVTGASNAAECVFTIDNAAGASALAKGDRFILTGSPWIRLSNAVLVVKAATATSVTALALDTTDATKYPAGAFSATVKGELRKITNWVDFPYITNVAQAGGDQQTTSFQPLQVDEAIQLNTFKNARSVTYTLTHDMDDPVRPILVDGDATQEIHAIQFINPKARAGKGEIRLYAAKISFNEVPSAEVNNVETVQAVVSMASTMRFYQKDVVDALA